MNNYRLVPMKKIFLSLLIALWIFCSTITWADVFAVWNLDDYDPQNSWINNEVLDDFGGWAFWTVNETWTAWITWFILKIAKDAKNIVYVFATIVFLVLVIKILFASNTEEEAKKFRMWIVWLVIWIIVMQLSYSIVLTLFGNGVDEETAKDLIANIFMPLIELLYYAVAFVFLAVAIFSFYMIITANGDEEKAKKWKLTIVYALLGFIVIRFAKVLVEASYTETYNPNGAATVDLISTLAQVLNWVQSFLFVILVLMIIFAWAQILTSNGEEEKITKARKSFVYIVIGLFILVTNYLILTFLLAPEI